MFISKDMFWMQEDMNKCRKHSHDHHCHHHHCHDNAHLHQHHSHHHHCHHHPGWPVAGRSAIRISTPSCPSSASSPPSVTLSPILSSWCDLPRYLVGITYHLVICQDINNDAICQDTNHAVFVYQILLGYILYHIFIILSLLRYECIKIISWCTMHSLQSKCTCELFAYPLGLNLCFWCSGPPTIYQCGLQSSLKVWWNSRPSKPKLNCSCIVLIKQLLL